MNSKISEKISDIKYFRKDHAGVFILSFLLFILLVFFLDRSDIQIHILHVKKINIGEAVYPPTIIFYILINLLSLFSKSLGILKITTVFVLSFSVTAKYIITKKIMKEFMAIRLVKSNEIEKYISWTAFFLLFVFAIPDYYNVFVLEKYYLGRVVPNVWHNSTIIFLMPFALALFWKQFKILNEDFKASNKSLVILTSLIIINLLIKPSFFFVYAPITILFLLYKFRISVSFYRNSFPIFIGFLVLFAQYIIIYYFQYGYLSVEESHVGFSSPFEVWAEFIPKWYIPISLLISYILPILFYVFYIKKYRDLELLDKYTLAMTILGLLISVFIIEEGPRSSHANFLWQNIICCYILTMLTSIHILTKFFLKGIVEWKIKILATVFFLQFISGVVYLGYIIINNNFY